MRRKILIIIFLIWYVYYVWFSEYIKYLVGYSFKEKCVGKIVGFAKKSLDERNNIQYNYYSVISCGGKNYLKKRSFSDKIGQEIMFVETNKEKTAISDNADVLYSETYDTKYKIPYLNLGRILTTIATLYILWKNFIK